MIKYGRSRWPRGLGCRSAAARFLGLEVRIPLAVLVSVLSVVCCQGEVSATGRSLLHGTPTECVHVCVCVCVCVIECDQM
jgi:MFS superfamily sulfate permease-like transporter